MKGLQYKRVWFAPRRWFAGAPLLLGMLAISPVFAADEAPLVPDSAIVAERGGASLTVGEMRTRLRMNAPDEYRRTFFADGEKVARMIDGMLLNRQLAAKARAEGLDQDPEFLAELDEYVIEKLARRRVARYLDTLPQADTETLAHERYLANKTNYVLPERRDVRQILITLDKHSDDEARTLAQRVHDLLVRGEDFDTTLDQYSEDPEVAINGWVRGIRASKSGYDPAFTEAVFALSQPGDISVPVKTVFGYHVIRLQEIIPARLRTYDEVKGDLLEAVDKELRDKAREAYLEEFIGQPLHLNDETMTQLPTATP